MDHNNNRSVQCKVGGSDSLNLQIAQKLVYLFGLILATDQLWQSGQIVFDFLHVI